MKFNNLFKFASLSIGLMLFSCTEKDLIDSVSNNAYPPLLF